MSVCHDGPLNRSGHKPAKVQFFHSPPSCRVWKRQLQSAAMTVAVARRDISNEDAGVAIFETGSVATRRYTDLRQTIPLLGLALIHLSRGYLLSVWVETW